MTSPRFEKKKEGCPIGPGSYELGSTLDEQHGARIDGPERFHENAASETPGPGFYNDNEEVESKTPDAKRLTRTPSKGRKSGLGPSTKENRTGATPGQEVKRRAPAVSAEAKEVEQLKKQLNNEEKLRAQAEAKAADLAAAKKWATEAQVQLQS